MHELGIISAVIKTVEKIALDEKLTKIEKIVLQVGELSGMVPEYIKTCYPAAVYKTSLEDTELELEIVPGIARCRDCNEEFNAVECDLKCPKCGSQSLEALSGRDFVIKEILAC
ncbi:MAG: hydrogenase maturation nickel metallochaperone HypA [Oscillospiraceae bacterium]